MLRHDNCKYLRWTHIATRFVVFWDFWQKVLRTFWDFLQKVLRTFCTIDALFSPIIAELFEKWSHFLSKNDASPFSKIFFVRKLEKNVRGYMFRSTSRIVKKPKKSAHLVRPLGKTFCTFYTYWVDVGRCWLGWFVCSTSIADLHFDKWLTKISKKSLRSE